MDGLIGFVPTVDPVQVAIWSAHACLGWHATRGLGHVALRVLRELGTWAGTRIRG